MTSSGLEWDSLDCPLVGLPTGCKSHFPTDSDNTDLWRCQINSLWSVSSATGCNTSSRTGGSRRCRLKQEEDEEGRRQWRRNGKEPGRSGRVKEVSQICSHWASGNLFPPILPSLNKVQSSTAAAAVLGSVLIWLAMTLSSSSPSSFSSISNGNHHTLLFSSSAFMSKLTC